MDFDVEGGRIDLSAGYAVGMVVIYGLAIICA